MDWVFKAVLTAGTVFVVAAVARQLGQRAAGVMAALPIITAPTLAWVSYEKGVGFAVSAAIGSVSATAIMAFFALGYARGSHRGGVTTAVICGLAAALAISVPAAIFSARLTEALVLALVCCALAFMALPIKSPMIMPATRSRGAPIAIAIAAGGLSALAATIGPDLGGFATGLLSSLPLIGGGVAILEHASSGPRAAQQFLHGYVRGLFGKTAFGAVFALLAVQVGSASALLLAGGTAWLLSQTWGTACLRLPSLRRWI